MLAACGSGGDDGGDGDAGRVHVSFPLFPRQSVNTRSMQNKALKGGGDVGRVRPGRKDASPASRCYSMYVCMYVLYVCNVRGGIFSRSLCSQPAQILCLPTVPYR